MKKQNDITTDERDLRKLSDVCCSWIHMTERNDENRVIK
jgi:hypothetical protein